LLRIHNFDRRPQPAFTRAALSAGMIGAIGRSGERISIAAAFLYKGGVK
jgi:hypothetical protein